MKNFSEEEEGDFIEGMEEGRGAPRSSKVVEEGVFSWCGLLIDMNTLEVRNDYSKSLQGGIHFLFVLLRLGKLRKAFMKDVADTLTLDFNRHPGEMLRQRLLQ
jgi:hypothetical protein